MVKKIFFLFFFALATSSAFGMDQTCPMLEKHQYLLETKFSGISGFDQWASVYRSLVADFDNNGDSKMRDEMIVSFLFIEKLYSCYIERRMLDDSPGLSFVSCDRAYSAPTCLCQYLLNTFWKALLADHTL